MYTCMAYFKSLGLESQFCFVCPSFGSTNSYYIMVLLIATVCKEYCKLNALFLDPESGELTDSDSEEYEDKVGEGQLSLLGIIRTVLIFLYFA